MGSSQGTGKLLQNVTPGPPSGVDGPVPAVGKVACAGPRISSRSILFAREGSARVYPLVPRVRLSIRYKRSRSMRAPADPHVAMTSSRTAGHEARQHFLPGWSDFDQLPCAHVQLDQRATGRPYRTGISRQRYQFVLVGAVGAQPQITRVDHRLPRSEVRTPTPPSSTRFGRGRSLSLSGCSDSTGGSSRAPAAQAFHKAVVRPRWQRPSSRRRRHTARARSVARPVTWGPSRRRGPYD